MGNKDENKKSIFRKASGIGLSTLLVMIGLFLSKATGFMRDAFVANKFNGIYRDSYTLAFTIPDLFYNLLVGGAIQSSVTPVLSGYIAKNEEKKGLRVVSIFISVMAVVMAVVCTLGVVFSSKLYSSYEYISGFIEKLVGRGGGQATSADIVHLASQASKWLFPQIFFMMLAALCIGILNAYKRFSSTSFGPTIYNVCVVLAIAVFAGNSERQLMLCTAGIMGATVIYFLYQYIVGFDKLKYIRFSFHPTDKEFIILFKRALPVLISASIVQINMVVLNNFALIFDGSQVSALRQASTIWQLPYGIFAVGVGNVMLPTLAGMYEKKDYSDAKSFLTSRLRTALFMTIPSAAFILAFSYQTVLAIFQWNASSYTSTDASYASVFLIGYSTSIITQSVVFIMNQAFYAIGRTKVPLLAGVISLVSNPLICLALLKFTSFGPMTITIAYSTTSLIQLIVLVILYNRKKELSVSNIGSFLIKTFAASVIAVLPLKLIEHFTYSRFEGAGKIVKLAVFACYGIVFVLIYFVLAYILKLDESKYWIDKFLGKLKKNKNTAK